MTDAYRHGLSDEQAKAAFSRTNTMCLAGAGSGKTRTAVVRLNWLASYYSDPACILALTFTRKAAGEMRERLFSMGEHPFLDRLETCTFHGWASRYLRKMTRSSNGSIEGRDQYYTIADEIYQKRIIKGLMDDDVFPKMDGSDMYMDKNGKMNPKKFLSYYMPKKDASYGKIELSNHAEEYLMERYEKAMRASNAVDYTDLINMSIRYMERNPSSKPNYKHIVVDEFQDTSDSQYRMLQLMSEHAIMFCVGDIDQSIYQWRGATPANITRYIKEYKAELLRLSDNYRSAPCIVHGANALIEHNRDRLDKVMNPIHRLGNQIRYIETDTQKDQANLLASEIATIQQRTPDKTIGILYRKNMSSMLIEKALVREGIAYAVKKDVGFMNRREIQAVVSLLKAIVNPRDTQSFIVNLSHFVQGISTDRAIEISEHLKSGHRLAINEDVPAQEYLVMGVSYPMNAIGLQGVKINIPTQKRLGYFMNAMYLMSEAAKNPECLVKISQELLSELWLTKLIKFSGDTEEKRKAREENIHEFLKWMSEYESIGDFLDSILLDIGAETEDSNVSLMTIHGSKGLEFDFVYLVDASEHNFTGRVNEHWEYEEARRLMYVAMTRSKLLLTITNPDHIMSFQSDHEENPPCHFLWEIPPEHMPSRPHNEGSQHRFSKQAKKVIIDDSPEMAMH